jgi:hypothetical protein
MHYRVPCRSVAHVPRVSVEPDNYWEAITIGYEFATTLIIANIGNAALTVQDITVQYIDDDGWIGIGSYNSSIPIAGADTISVILNLGATLPGSTSFYDANIIINTDAPTGQIMIPVELWISTPPPPTYTILNTSTKKISVYPTGRLGGDNDSLSLDIAGDCDADLESPNGDLYLYDASPMISWHNGDSSLAYTTVFTQWFLDDGTFRPETGVTISNEVDYNLAVFSMMTTDLLFGVDVSLWGPTDGNDFVIGKYDFYLIDSTRGLDEVYLGMILDWDIPSDNSVDNSSGYDPSLNTVWQRGVQTDSSDENPPHSCPILENNRLGGISVLSGPPGTMWTAENAPMQYGSGFHPDSLYNRMSGVGVDLYAETGEDSVVDLHTGVTCNRAFMSSENTVSFVIALATTNQGQSDYLQQVEDAFYWAEDHDIIGAPCICVPGDANGDGQVNVGDAVYIISYVFKGGDPPTPYNPCSGDANGDCECNVGDAVYIIRILFYSGPPTPTCDQWVARCGSYE